MLGLAQINEKVDNWLCAAACQDSQNAKMGLIDRNLRAKMVKVSTARTYSVRWNKEQVNRYKCWLSEDMNVI